MALAGWLLLRLVYVWLTFCDRVLGSDSSTGRTLQRDLGSPVFYMTAMAVSVSLFLLLLSLALRVAALGRLSHLSFTR